MPGYNVVLVEAVKGGLLCPHCRMVLRDAVQTLEEGYRLCESCYKEICLMPNRTCSDCEISIGELEQIYPDRAVRRDILSLLVKCSYCTAGCPWQGQLKFIDDHMDTCRYRPMQCPNEGCEMVLPPTELDKHVDSECPFRLVMCEYCQMRLPARALEEHHSGCPKYPIHCDRCEAEVNREQLQEHYRNSCTRLRCAVPGCDALLQRKDAPTDNGVEAASAHLNNPVVLFDHMQALAVSVQDIQETLSSLQSQVKRLQSQTGHTSSFEFESLKNSVTQSLSVAQQRIALVEGNMKQLQSSTSDKNRVAKIDDLQKTIQQQNVKIAKLEQQVDSLRKQQSEKARGGVGMEQGWKMSEHARTETGEVPTSRLVQLERKVEEVERQNAMLKVHVSELELQLQASLASTHNGAFLWRIPDVARRKRDAVEERITSIYSPPFYTGRNGYKMCIRAYLNGDGIGLGTHLSIFFVLMKGEYDPLLKWPFENKVSLILVDQNHRKHVVQTFKPTPESSSFQRPRSDMNVASGCPQFAKLTVLDDTNYVKEDIMYVKCIVDTSRIFHP